MKITDNDYVTIHQAIHKGKSDVTIKGNKYDVTTHKNGCRKVTIPELGTFIEQNPDQQSEYSQRAKDGESITWLIRDVSWGLIVNDEVINQ